MNRILCPESIIAPPSAIGKVVQAGSLHLPGKKFKTESTEQAVSGSSTQVLSDVPLESSGQAGITRFSELGSRCFGRGWASWRSIFGFGCPLATWTPCVVLKQSRAGFACLRHTQMGGASAEVACQA